MTRAGPGRFQRPAQLRALADSVLAFLEARRHELESVGVNDKNRVEVAARRANVAHAMRRWGEVRWLGDWDMLGHEHRVMVEATLATGRYDDVVRRAY